MAVQEQLLGQTTDQLTSARAKLTQLKAQYAQDIRTLAAQLRADYESPPPTLVGVVVDSGGFDALLNGLQNLTAIQRSNVHTTASVKAARIAVQTQAAHLAQVQTQPRSAPPPRWWTSATQWLSSRLSIVNRELAVERARNQDTSQLAAVRKQLVHEAHILDQRAAEAQTAQSGGAVAPPTGCANTPFVAHGGEFGFFQAPGTNYSVK